MATSPAPIRTGETAPQATIAQLKEKATRVYHHMNPGARFVMPDGLEIRFMGGQFTTQDPEIIVELDKVLNKPASMIYDKPEPVAAAALLAKSAAADAVQKLADNT